MSPRSLDLNPCDFFLSGYFKVVLYNPPPKILDDLEENNNRVRKKIPKEALKSYFFNFEKKMQFSFFHQSWTYGTLIKSKYVYYEIRFNSL